MKDPTGHGEIKKLKELKKVYHINAAVDVVWQALVDPRHIKGWGGGPAVMHAENGSKFSLWGGQIHGTTTDVVAPNTLVQDWYAGKWLQGSVATFTLDEEGKGTKLILIHRDIPDNEYEDIDKGWDDYYLGPLKKYVEKNHGPSRG